VIALTLAFAFTDSRLTAWEGLLPFFGWMETTVLGEIGKTYGAVFAVVEAVHLLAMALLGGAVLISEARLVGLMLSNVPARTVIDKSHRLFVVALLAVILTGVFMACGVAMKIYYLEVFFYKMLVLSAGILFTFFIRRPLLQQDLDSISPTVKKCVALSSLLIWFTVAAAGRWIGFS
jgi:type III secretory pathway component EscS